MSSVIIFWVCQDPHGELQGQNVLIVRYSVELTAARFGLSVAKVSELLASARAKMAEVRKSRPAPHLDTKMLASWNGKSTHTLHPGLHLMRECISICEVTKLGDFRNPSIKPLSSS